MAATTAPELAARLDRLPMTRHIWMLVTLISMGGWFELYDLFLTAYIAPGLVRAGYFKPESLGVFNILGPYGVAGVGTFVFALFAGLFVGAIFLGHFADRYGRRTVFTFSLIWYSITTAVMAFQTTGFGGRPVALHRRHRHRHRTGHHRHLRLRTGAAHPSRPRLRLQPGLPVPHRAGHGVPRLAAGAAGAVRLRRLALGGADRLGRRDLRLVHPPRAAGIAALAGPPRPHRRGRAGRRRHRNAAWPPRRAAPCLRVGAPEAGEAGEGTFAEIWQPPYDKRAIVLSVFNFFQTFGYYGFAAWVPTLLISKGISITTSLEYSFIIAIANPVGPLLGTLIADRIERKWQVCLGAIGIGVFGMLFANAVDPDVDHRVRCRA